MRSPIRAALAATVVAALAVALASCAADPDPAPAGATPAGAGFPVDVTNCGRTLHFDAPPTRIVSGWPTSTELLIALGATDALVGQYNTNTGEPGQEYAAAYAKVPVLGEGAPSRERLVAAAPQLIWADGEYLFDGTALPTIAELAAQGIQVMVLSGFCGTDASGAKVRDVVTDVTALGKILGRPADADRLVAGIDDRLDTVARRVAGQPVEPVALVTMFDRQLYVYEGVYSDIATLAGATNIYTGVLPKGSYYGELSVEDIIKRDPATLVYLLSGGETEAAARDYLTKTLPTVAAVRTGSVVFLPQNDSTNLRGIAGVETLAAALHPAGP